MTTHPDELLQPPYSIDLIADLHADNLPDDIAPQLWTLATADTDASHMLAALDRVTAELHGLGSDSGVASTIPPEVAARLDRALGLAPPVVVDISARRRRWPVLAGAAASIAAAVALVFAVTTVRSSDSRPDAPVAQDSPPAQVDLGSDLSATTMLSAIGRHDAPGRLADPTSLTRCLAANDIAANRTVLGSTSVRYEGKDAVLVLVAGPKPPQITALVVGQACGSDGGQQLAKTNIG